MKRLLPILLLLAASNAYAVTEVTRYVNGTCPNNGDGTTNDCADGTGLAGAHSNICYAVKAEYTIGFNLVTRDVNVTFSLTDGASPDSCDSYCGLDSTVIGQDFDYPGCDVLEVLNTDATHSFHLLGDPADPYRISHAGEDAASIDIPPYGSAKYIDVVNTSTTATRAISVKQGAKVESSIVHCGSEGSTGVRAGIELSTYSGGPSIPYEARIINNIIYGCKRGVYVTNFGPSIDGLTENTRYGLYNNTIVDSYDHGIYVSSCTNVPLTNCSTTDEDESVLFLANNLIQGSDDADFSWGASCNTAAADTNCFHSLGANATSDTTSPDGATYQNQTASFRDAVNGDYRLQYNDLTCLRRGEDLSADEFYPVTLDNQSQTRATSGNDCGGDYVPPEEISTHRLRSGLKDRIKKLHQ